MIGLSCASVHHVTIAVTDLDESVGWHQTVLKAEREKRKARRRGKPRRSAIS
jgi:catechol 2,3-dioxygenase-like lactoylglutathione lyase family enzyme